MAAVAQVELSLCLKVGEKETASKYWLDSATLLNKLT